MSIMLNFILESGKSGHDRLAFGSFEFVGAGKTRAVDVVKGCCLQQSVGICEKESDTDYNFWPTVCGRNIGKGGFV